LCFYYSENLNWAAQNIDWDAWALGLDIARHKPYLASIVEIRPVTRGGEASLKDFSPPWENVLDVV